MTKRTIRLLPAAVALLVLLIGSATAAETTTASAADSSSGEATTQASTSPPEPLPTHQLMPSDLNKFLQAIPDLLVSIPGVGPVDINKLPPWFVEHVMRGGALPGVQQKTVDAIVKQYMHRMYAAAAQELGRNPPEDVPPLPKGVDPKLYLRPVTELPASFVSSVLQGYPLPHLSSEQTQVVKEYYLQGMPVLSALMNAASEADVKELFSPKVLAMIKLMPPGFDYTRLPPEVLKTVMAGEVPDMSLLPPDVQQDLKKHLDHVFNAMNSTPGIPVDEILAKLPYYEPPQLPAYSPYDINTVDRGLVVKQRGEAEGKDLDAEAIRFFTTIGVAGIILLTVICIGIALYRLRQAGGEGPTYDSLTASFDADDKKERELARLRGGRTARIDDDEMVV